MQARTYPNQTANLPVLMHVTDYALLSVYDDDVKFKLLNEVELGPSFEYNKQMYICSFLLTFEILIQIIYEIK